MNDEEINLRKLNFERLKYAAARPGQLTFYGVEERIYAEQHAEHQKMFNELTVVQKDVLAIKLTLMMAGEVNDEVKRVLSRIGWGAYSQGSKFRAELHKYFSEKCLQELGI